LQNGAFPIQTNDPICIYFEDERPFFEDDGSRKPRSIIGDFENRNDAQQTWMNMAEWMKEDKLQQSKESGQPKTSSERLRMMYHDRENGNYPATATEGKFVGKIQVARSAHMWLVFPFLLCISARSAHIWLVF
jgi:hypothetical protein